MREADNISALTQLPIDYIGFIFFAGSRRFVGNHPPVPTLPQLKRVGVFVNSDRREILDQAREYQLDAVQLHGEETPPFCHEVRAQALQVIKVFSIDENFDFSITMAFEDSCDYFLFDTKGKNRGGNGVAFDWLILKEYRGKVPFLLAGGIRPGMEYAVKNFEHKKFHGIDLNSGFEIEPGKKDIEKLKKFIDEVRGGSKRVLR